MVAVGNIFPAVFTKQNDRLPRRIAYVSTDGTQPIGH
jgi:hypothetical protein